MSSPACVLRSTAAPVSFRAALHASKLENQNLRIIKSRGASQSSRNKVLRSHSLACCRCTLLRMLRLCCCCWRMTATIHLSSVPLRRCCTWLQLSSISFAVPLSVVPAGASTCGQPVPLIHGLHASTRACSTHSSYSQLVVGRGTPAKPTALSRRRRLPRFAQIVEDVEQVHRE